MRIRNPFLIIREIMDEKVRRNFEALERYFNENNQLLDFRLLAISESEAVTQKKLAHGLPYAPTDLIETSRVGGTLTWHHELFDAQFVVYSTSGACAARYLVGRYRGGQL